MKKYLLLLLTAFLYKTSSLTGVDNEPETIGGLFNKVGSKICEKYGFEFRGNGTTGMKQIDSVCFTFKTSRHLKKKAARKRILDVTEDVFKLLNEEQNRKFNFRDFPFTHNNLAIFINCSKNGDYAVFPYVSSTRYLFGKVAFVYYKSSSDCIPDFEIRETYEEAVRKANEKADEADPVVPKN